MVLTDTGTVLADTGTGPVEDTAIGAVSEAVVSLRVGTMRTSRWHPLERQPQENKRGV